MKKLFPLYMSICLMLLSSCEELIDSEIEVRKIEKFTSHWKFKHGDLENAFEPGFDDSGWQELNLPHDWSIDEPYNIDNPGGPGSKFMIGGVGWYRKSFIVGDELSGKRVEITFDGVYKNSSVWINGTLLGMRPYGYISFRYDITPYLITGKENIIAVKVDNSAQPNSRWYSGSGIYRNVWLTVTDKTYIEPWDFVITTPEVTSKSAQIKVTSVIHNNHDKKRDMEVFTSIFDSNGNKLSETVTLLIVEANHPTEISQDISLKDPLLWSVDNPSLYTVKQTIKEDGNTVDDYKTEFGIRYFNFDRDKGFFLNDKPVKIKGVCMHHDLGALGAALNVRALERQLQILKEMGCNSIRTSHNPPAPEMLQLCDKMGFIVLDETFDVWKMKKTEYDYSLFWDEWHQKDLHDHIVRDRNHPSVFIWSIGNEIVEQWQPQGTQMTKELVDIVRSLDSTRPVTTGNNNQKPDNSLIKSGVLDLIGYNYAHNDFEKFKEWHNEKPFIGTETTSALATRGSYDMPSDSVRRWPLRWDQLFVDGNPDNSCSAYDNCSAPWGSTHEESWKLIKKHDYLSGLYIWTGFDYLGEPTPYVWPSRSSYFGIIDLAGFPKDVYYMYQSEWSDKTVLHLFPHWNWSEGEEVDVWAYYNNADEVELFLNDISLGVKQKAGDELHVQWRVQFKPGVLKAVSRKGGKEVMTKEIYTAGDASQISATADRTTIKAGGEDLSFITVDVLDNNGNLVPNASNYVNVKINGDATIAGVDNGNQINHDPFKAEQVKAFNGKCLVIIRSGLAPGNAQITISSEGMKDQNIDISMF